MPRRTFSNVPRNTARKRPRRKPMSLKPRLILAGITAVLGLLAWAGIARGFAPSGNTKLTRFDAIIVLGSPVDSDGNPRPEQLARVTEAVREYQRGVAPRLILTGGPTHHHFVEARVMARSAEAQGIPESAIFLEPEAMNTVQNACYSAQIMKDHGWRSAEIVSSRWHLPRAELIFDSLPLVWSAHASPPLSPQSPAYLDTLSAVEVLKTARYLVWARWADTCTP